MSQSLYPDPVKVAKFWKFVDGLFAVERSLVALLESPSLLENICCEFEDELTDLRLWIGQLVRRRLHEQIRHLARRQTEEAPR